MNRDQWIKFLATGFGAGTIPVAPGTFGTLVAVPLYLILIQFPVFVYMGITFALVIGAIFVAEKAEALMGTHDSKSIVVDEIVGFLVAMVWVPPHWKTLLAGFVLFRLFDAAKPWPISKIDKQVKGGFGVVADDVIAGIFTSIVLQYLLGYTTFFGLGL